MSRSSLRLRIRQAPIFGIINTSSVITRLKKLRAKSLKKLATINIGGKDYEVTDELVEALKDLKEAK